MAFYRMLERNTSYEIWTVEGTSANYESVSVWSTITDTCSNTVAPLADLTGQEYSVSLDGEAATSFRKDEGL
jgi:hypothetical protein